VTESSQDRDQPLVVGLAASTRRGGNSDTLLRAVLDGAEACGARTETIVLAARAVAPCIGCQRCQATGECVIADDFQQIRDRLLDADAVIFATPIYFWNVPSPAKAYIDRNQSTGARKALARKEGRSLRPAGRTTLGVILAVAADPTPKFAGAKQTLEALFRSNEITAWDELLVTGLFGPGEAASQEDLLARARDLGGRLAEAIGD